MLTTLLILSERELNLVGQLILVCVTNYKKLKVMYTTGSSKNELMKFHQDFISALSMNQ